MEYLFPIAIVLLLVYEGYALWTRDVKTISRIFWDASKRPLLPFAMGFLMGHFFW